MKNLFINNCYKFIKNYKKLSYKEELKIKYGLEILYHFITKTVIILALSLIFNSFTNILLFNIFYLLLRSAAHGIHANSNLGCWILTIIIYLLVILFINYSVITNYSILFLSFLSIISFIIWSPSDTKYLPLIRKRDRLRLKIISIFLLLTEIIISKYYFTKVIFSAIIVEIININPVTYKFLGIPFNNHANYE